MQSLSTTRSPILPTEAYRFALAERLRAAQTKCLIISAYLTVDGLRWMAECLPAGIEVSILTRWEASDLVAGASDTAAYRLAKSRGWDFRILHELHAKCCLVDDDTFFIGSANVTNRGLCLMPGGNRELGLYAQATTEDVQTVWSLLRCGVVITDDLVGKIEKWLKSVAPSRPGSPRFAWPEEIENYLADNLIGLWVADLPWSPAQNVTAHLRGESFGEKELADVRHDLAIFSAFTLDTLGPGFRASNCFRWLLNILSRNPAEPFAYYGRLTECLHDGLLDDPRPYRKDVKSLLSNLISYSIEFGQPFIIHDRPNYSERLSLQR